MHNPPVDMRPKPIHRSFELARLLYRYCETTGGIYKSARRRPASPPAAEPAKCDAAPDEDGAAEDLAAALEEPAAELAACLRVSISSSPFESARGKGKKLTEAA